MRVVFQTQPVPAKVKQPDGTLADGMTHFRALLYEPGEPTNPTGAAGEPGGRLVTEWRADVGTGQTLRVPADVDGGIVPDALIPASLLDTLPPTSRLQLLWSWTRTEG